jgi:hypothetical protein
MPFYRRLASLPEVTSRRVSLVVVSLQPVAEMDRYLNEHGVTVSSVISLRESGVRVRGTPALVLTTPDGVVLASWGGWLPAHDENSVVAAVNTLSRAEVP